MRTANNNYNVKNGLFQKLKFRLIGIVDRILKKYDGTDWLLQRKAKTLLSLILFLFLFIVTDLIASSLILKQIAPEFISNLSIVTGLVLVFILLIKGRYHIASALGIIVVLGGITWTRYVSTGHFSSDAAYDFLQYVLDLTIVIFYANLIAHRRLIINVTIISSIMLLGVYTYTLPTLFHNAISSATISVFFGGFLFLILAGLISIFTFLQNRKAIEIANLEAKSSKESEQKFHAIIEGIPEALFIAGTDGCFIEVNKAACDQLKYTREELLQMNVLDILPSEEHISASRRMQNESNEAGLFESIHICKDGSSFPVELSLVSLIVGGKPAFTALARNITERKQTEEALQESEARFSVLSEASFEGIVISDRGWIIDVNEQMAAMLGYERSEMAGLKVEHFVAPESVELVMQHIRSGSEDPYEHLSLRKNGSKFPVEIRAKSLPYKGRVVRVTAIRDITKRTQAEEALRESERKARAIFDLSFGFIGLLTPDGILIEANRTALEFIGARLSDVAGKPFWETPWWIHSEKMQKELRKAVKEAASGQIVNFEATHKSAKGRIHTVDFFLRPIINDDGKVIFLLPEGIDITDRKITEEAIKQSEIRYRTLFESANDAIFLMDEKKFIDCNQKTLEIFGCTKNQIIGSTPIEFSPFKQPDGRDSQEKAVEKISIAIKSQSQFFEWKHCKADGSLFDAEVSLNQVAIGTQVYLQAIVRDISTRKIAEEALRESEQRYRRLIEFSPVAIVVHYERKFVYANPAAITFLGAQNEDQIIGMSVFNVLHPDYVETTIKRIALVEQNINVPTIEAKFIRLDGKVIEGEVTTIPILFKGKPAIQTIVYDITERKRAEDKLRESEERYRSLFENAPVGVFYSTIGGKIIGVNDEYARMMGYTSPDEAKEIVNRSSIAECIYVHSDERQEVIEKVTAIPGNWFRTEKQFCRKDGIQITANLVVRVLPDNPDYLEGFLEDITERKRAERTCVKVKNE